jgi:hypothetical protein
MTSSPSFVNGTSFKVAVRSKYDEIYLSKYTSQEQLAGQALQVIL